MVARDDGHIVDGPPPAVVKPDAKPINSTSPTKEGDPGDLPM
jgi:hypothetical protein